MVPVSSEITAAKKMKVFVVVCKRFLLFFPFTIVASLECHAILKHDGANGGRRHDWFCVISAETSDDFIRENERISKSLYFSGIYHAARGHGR